MATIGSQALVIRPENPRKGKKIKKHKTTKKQNYVTGEK